VRLGAPVALTEAHACGAFDCGHPSLNQWLAGRALRNQVAGASRTYVACHSEPQGPVRVVAYSTLASGAVAAKAATGRFRRNMPDPIPVVLLARLAVDRHHQGRGLGRALLCGMPVAVSYPRPTPSASAVCWCMRSTIPHAACTSTWASTLPRWTP
jgi:GNAT superfamily N-acetyltransferase